MFKRILIPLDGSPFAERALQPGFEIAKAFAAEVLLLRVLASDGVLASLPALAYGAALGTSTPANGNGAGDYLRQICQEWSNVGVPVDAKVVTGAPAGAIVNVAREACADMIVMSTHGRSAVGRIIYGSVAEAVLRGTHLPVLLIPIHLPY